MPKKTREEKIAAQLRRLKQQIASQEIGPQEVPDTKTPPVSSPTISLDSLAIKSPAATPLAKPKLDRYSYSYVSSDLKKIAVLAAAMIIFEISVNLTLRTDFAKLLLRSFGIDLG